MKAPYTAQANGLAQSGTRMCIPVTGIGPAALSGTHPSGSTVHMSREHVDYVFCRALGGRVDFDTFRAAWMEATN